MSLNFTTLSPFFVIIRSLNSSTVRSLPRVLIVSSVLSPSILPEGSSTFSRVTALRTSSGVSPYAASLAGSIFILMASFFDPHTLTALTPEMVCSLSLKLSSAYWLTSIMFLVSLLSVTAKMGCASASAFWTTGGSTSWGRRRMAPETLSRTSFTAVSISTSSLNSTVMRDDPSLLELDIERIPWTLLIADSRGSVICVSMTSELAPGNEVETVTMAGSTLG